MLLFDMLDQKNFIIVNKPLIFSLGHECTIIYQELVSRYRYFKNMNKLDAEGFFYNTVDDLYLGTGFTWKQQKKYIDQLIGKGLVIQENRKKYDGTRVRHFKIILDESLLKQYMDEGNIIIEELEKTLKVKQEEKKQYLKDYNKKTTVKVVHIDISGNLQNGDSENIDAINPKNNSESIQNSGNQQNEDSQTEEMEIGKPPKSSLNKNNSNKTNLNNVVVEEEEKSQSDENEPKDNQLVKNSVLSQNSKVGYQHIIEDVKKKLTDRFGFNKIVDKTISVIESDISNGKTISNMENYSDKVYQNILNNDTIKREKAKSARKQLKTENSNIKVSNNHTKTKFHNFEETFTKYDSDELEDIVQQLQSKWDR